MTTIEHFAGPAELGDRLAREIADLMAESFKNGRRFVLGCPGGRSPMSTYAALAREVAEREFDLRDLIIAMMDDYVVEDEDGWHHVDADAHYSCCRFARVEIQGRLNEGLPSNRQISHENVWLPDPQDPSAYDERLAHAGGIDFFILASGSGDGHVAFNPPGTSADSRSRIVTLNEQTRIDNLGTFPQFKDVSEVPTHGITVGIRTISQLSRRCALVLSGSDKTQAFRRITSVKQFDPSWPASVVYSVAQNTILVDDRSVTLNAVDRD